jgi:histidyl-tRNA synthetase
MRAFDADDRRTKETMRGAPLLLDRLAPEDAEHFERVKSLLDGAGVRYELDPTLVRGLDYYARTLWEFTSGALGAQSAVGGGGRYDGLIEQLGGPPTPGVGWAAGIERMLMAAGEQPVPAAVVDLFVAIAARDSTEAHDVGFRLANEARRAGLSAQLELAGRGLKGQLKHADRLGARYVAIIGDPMQISLKDMEAGDQTEVGPDAVIPTILRGSRVA